MPDIFDEVTEDLRADQARSLLRRYGVLLIAAMVLTLVGVGVWQVWQEHRQAATDALAARFIAAQAAAEAKTPPKDTAKQFADIAESAPDGYRTLARLQLAALEWNAGQRDSAIAEWQGVADDTGAPALLRDLATLTSVQYQLDSANPAVLKAKLAPLLQGGSRFAPLAEELTGLLDLRLGRTAQAREIMKQLMLNPQVPPGVRQTAQALLISLGETDATDAKAGKQE